MGTVTGAADDDDARELMELVEAAVPAEVRAALQERLGSERELETLLRSLATPPRTVCLRLTAAKEDGSDAESEALLKRYLSELGPRGGRFVIRRMEELSPPFCWLACPEARCVMAATDGNAQASSAPAFLGFTGAEVLAAEGAADAVIDAACAMAVLRGADVFCAGVMATSAAVSKGQAVRLWVIPVGQRVPTRGTILGSGPAAPAALPAVLVASGEAAMDRAEVFALPSSGVAVRVCWRRCSTEPLAPLNDILSDTALQGRLLLQQLPSGAAARILAPRPGDHVLDMCAAPGGKTTHLAQLLGNGGEGLFAADRSLAKVRRVESLLAAHGFGAVRCLAADSRHLCGKWSDGFEASSCSKLPSSNTAATTEEGAIDLADAKDIPSRDVCTDESWPPEVESAFNEALAAHGADKFRSHKRIWKFIIGRVGRDQVTKMQVQARLRTLASTIGTLPEAEQRDPVSLPFPPESFDRILLDAPCSAMGQRPLLRWGKSLAEVQDHADYQRHFLRTATLLLRPGGTLVYSTCTLTAEENEENVRWALDELPLELDDALSMMLSECPASSSDSSATQVAASRAFVGLAGCGLDDVERRSVLRFDPRVWDVGFFIARFRRVGR